ncbi:MAG: hypothetical protein ACRD2X_21525 [Vicinamibacteraceae bacterium]
MAEPDASSLAAAVARALALPEERERRCRIAMESARRVAWPQVTAQIFQCYDKLHQRRLTVDCARWSRRAAWAASSV